MSSVKLCSLPDDLYEKLKFSAALNHTSIENEVVSCLEKVLLPEKKKEKTQLERGVSLIDQMGLSYNSRDLKKYLETCC